MRCPICGRDKIPFVNKTTHLLYGFCKSCFYEYQEYKKRG